MAVECKSELSSCTVAESKGCIPNFYKALWTKTRDDVEPLQIENRDTLYLPHTVVYTHHCLTGWYFTSVKDGKLKKRLHKHETNEEILRIFEKVMLQHKQDCAATYTWSYDTESNSPSTREYFTLYQLRNFLWSRTDKYYGVLQCFIPPSGFCNKTIKATYTPHIFISESRITSIPMHLSQKYSMAQRYSTFGNNQEKYSKLKKLDKDSMLGDLAYKFSKKIIKRAEQYETLHFVYEYFKNIKIFSSQHS